MADTIALRLSDAPRPGGYRLTVDKPGVTVEGADAAAVFYGLQTLEQVLFQCPDRKLPCLEIEDWPDFAQRGVYYDVCRGRVPQLEWLMDLAVKLAQAKINELQLYIEHTFLFRGHPSIGKGASPLTADDILLLDEHCRQLHIELVPSLASFGHLATVLQHPEYRELAEDWGVGRYADPEAEKKLGRNLHGWTLSPANPRSYERVCSAPPRNAAK